MIDIAYEGFVPYFQERDDGDQITFLGTRELRVISDEIGFFGGDDNPVNDDLDITFIDKTLGAEVPVDGTGFIRVAFLDEDPVREGVFGVIDVDDDDDAEPFETFYLVRIEGDPLPFFRPNEDITAFLAANGGVVEETPAGYGPDDFISFRDIVGLEPLGALPGSDGISTEDARAVALFYEGALGRQPDIPGLNFWINEFERDVDLETMAGFFIESDEFELLFGDVDDLSNRDYVQRLYQNILDRDPDSAGWDFWEDELEIAGFSRENVLVRFTQSVENFEGSEYLVGIDEVANVPDTEDWTIVL